jgi:predicted TIM-barrel fold metal-dependent hydrolase
MTELYRIDVHHHPSPPSYLAARFARDEQYHQQRSWSVDRSLEDMEKGGVATAMLSLPHSVKIWPGEADEARGLARDWNEFMAKIAVDHPSRFGVFVALPMLDINASLREIEFAFDTLKADGVALMTNIGDKWLGDTYYAPVFEELNRRGAVVYTHPVAPNCCRGLLEELNDTVQGPLGRFCSALSAASVHLLACRRHAPLSRLSLSAPVPKRAAEDQGVNARWSGGCAE